ARLPQEGGRARLRLPPRAPRTGARIHPRRRVDVAGGRVDRQGPRVRIRGPILVLASIILIGAAAIYAVGHGRWSFGDAVYLAINAVSTVGFRELDGMENVRFSHVVVTGIILAGLGSVAYFQSSLTALLVQGVIGERFRMRRMQNKIDRLKDHVIVTGAGATGMHAIEELLATRTPMVVIDRSRDTLER